MVLMRRCASSGSSEVMVVREGRARARSRMDSVAHRVPSTAATPQAMTLHARSAVALLLRWYSWTVLMRAIWVQVRPCAGRAGHGCKRRVGAGALPGRQGCSSMPSRRLAAARGGLPELSLPKLLGLGTVIKIPILQARPDDPGVRVGRPGHPDGRPGPSGPSGCPVRVTRTRRPGRRPGPGRPPGRGVPPPGRGVPPPGRPSRHPDGASGCGTPRPGAGRSSGWTPGTAGDALSQAVPPEYKVERGIIRKGSSRRTWRCANEACTLLRSGCVMYLLAMSRPFSSTTHAGRTGCRPSILHVRIRQTTSINRFFFSV